MTCLPGQDELCSDVTPLFDDSQFENLPRQDELCSDVTPLFDDSQFENLPRQDELCSDVTPLFDDSRFENFAILKLPQNSIERRKGVGFHCKEQRGKNKKSLLHQKTNNCFFFHPYSFN